MKTLRQLRDERNLSRRALSIAIDVDPMTVYLWEQRGVRPTEINLRKLAEFYGVSVEELDVPHRFVGKPRRVEIAAVVS